MQNQNATVGKRTKIREAFRSYARGARSRASRTCRWQGLLPPMSRFERGQTVAQYHSLFQCPVRPRLEGNQAVAALHLMRISDASRKFQRL